MRNALMITAAVESSLRVLRMRCASSSPSIRGMTATPVSKPESPRARPGKRISAIPNRTQGAAVLGEKDCVASR